MDVSRMINAASMKYSFTGFTHRSYTQATMLLSCDLHCKMYLCSTCSTCSRRICDFKQTSCKYLIRFSLRFLFTLLHYTALLSTEDSNQTKVLNIQHRSRLTRLHSNILQYTWLVLYIKSHTMCIMWIDWSDVFLII